MDLGFGVAFALSTAAAALKSEPEVLPSAWAIKYAIVPDGPREGQHWSAELTPQLIEPMDSLAVHSRDNRVSLMKPGQAGGSQVGLNWLGCMIDTAPARSMIVEPTIDAAKEFNAEKLDPFIRATPVLNAKVRPQSQRSAYGSTVLRKKFSRGSCVLVGANAAPALSSKTIRFVLADETDRWPDDLAGQGHPMGMVDARQIAFTRSRLHKKFEISTPTTKGLSYIESAYLAGDQRKWFMPCPACMTGSLTFEWKNFRCNSAPPYAPHYVAQCCGGIIEPWQQPGMVRAGRWVAQKTGPGRHKSYHYQGLTNLNTDWETIARKWRAAEGNPALERTFYNLELGEPFEADSPETENEAIVAACEDYPRGEVPARVGRLVLVVDLNGDWFEWAVWGFGPSTSGKHVDQWLIDTGKIDGKPDDESAWVKIAELETRGWKHVSGRLLPVDMLGVDTGFGTHEVYKFVRGRPRARALDGRPPSARIGDPKKAMLLGNPTQVSAKNKLGQPIFKVWLYPVYGHDAKLWLAHALHDYAGGLVTQGGIHLPREIVDATIADQLTGEVLATVEKKDGRPEQRWIKRRGVRNEQLDLAVYARALGHGHAPNGLSVEKIGLEKWTEVLKDRHGLDDVQVAGLFHIALPKLNPASAPPVEKPPVATPAKPKPSTGQNFLGSNMKNWLK